MRRLITAAVMLFACFALAACADSDKRSSNNPFGGWYGGVVGGAAP
jgi:hypothetical protein